MRPSRPADDLTYTRLRTLTLALGARMSGKEYPDGMFCLVILLPDGRVVGVSAREQTICVASLLNGLVDLISVLPRRAPGKECQSEKVL